jgi:hypothetical protein
MRSIVTEGRSDRLNNAPSVTARIRAAPPPPRCG